MSDYEDSDDAYDSDDDWFYMEDVFNEADELAETQCPDPQPYDGNDVILQEYDPYEYWEDLKYLSDGGFQEDGPVKKKRKKQITQKASASTKPTSKKRKASVPNRASYPKRQRTARGRANTVSPTRTREEFVVWLSAQDRETLLADPILKAGSCIPVIITGNHDNTLATDSQKPNMDERHDSAIVAEGFDLNSISSVAGLLSSEHIDTLKAILEAQGLDPEALEVVLKDLIEGREPEFEEEEQDAGVAGGNGRERTG